MSNNKPELWVIMPVYNEQACLKVVLSEWVPILRTTTKSFTLCALNDGSKDNSLQVLQSLQSKYPELHIVDKANTGHGQTCVYGYRLALSKGAQWIFQIDSDGQCDASYFKDFWNSRSFSAVTYGFRNRRGDGKKRFFISRAVSLFGYLATGVWVRDANVPYRLMSRESLEKTLPFVPADFHLANILVAILQKARFGILWKDIFFRARIGGQASGKRPGFFLKEARRLYSQLKRQRLALSQGDFTDGRLTKTPQT